ncbi:MAG: filamentous hemagglutinin N-terminal domain-containing protein [Pseudomonadota bacterium]
MRYTTKPLLALMLNLMALNADLSARSGGGLSADGTSGTRVNQHGDIFNITDGTRTGTNLWHSFNEFNLESSQTAQFQSDSGIRNIISRVTGPNDSWIDGTIRNIDNQANIYLLNPNGVMFGQNARLNVQGAFHASTADYITLTDGQRVYTDPGQTVTLTVAAPESFGFLDNSTGKIQVTGSQLEVQPGQTLSLIGGALQIEGTELRADGGQIHLIAVESAGKVQPALRDITNEKKADIHLTGSTVFVENQADSQSVGRLWIQGDQVTVQNSALRADHHSSVDATNTQVSILADDIHFTNGAILAARTTGSGNSGLVELKARNQLVFSGNDLTSTKRFNGLYIRNESQTQDAGASGTALLEATDIKFEDTARITATTRGPGKAGNIILRARKNIDFSGRSWISASTFGTGEGGSVTLEADGQIAFRGGHLTIAALSQGNAGTLNISAQDIHFSHLSKIGALTLGPGKGGTITMNARRQLSFTGSPDAPLTLDSGDTLKGVLEEIRQSLNISGSDTLSFQNDDFKVYDQVSSGIYAFSATANRAQPFAGASGNIILKANDIRFQDTAYIIAETLSTGRGGSVMLEALEQISFQDSDIRIGTNLTGTAGNLTMQSSRLMMDSAVFDSQTTRIGTAGQITIELAEALQMKGSSSIRSGSLWTETGAGSAGQITITADETIDITDSSALITSTKNAGGGNIYLKTRDRFRLQDQSRITTSVSGGDGRGGNITIISDNDHGIIFILLENSDIQANAYQGSGGNIAMKSDYLLRSGAVTIEASSQLSADGEINIQAVEFDDGSIRADTGVDPLNVTQWLPVPCAQRQGKSSRLMIAGYDAHPTPIDDLLSSLPIQAQILQAIQKLPYQPIELTVFSTPSLKKVESKKGCSA